MKIDDQLINNPTEPGKIIRLRVSQAADDPDWDTFVAEAQGGDHVQTSLWGQVKESLGWKSIRLIMQCEEQIVAGGQLLYYQAAPFIRVGYMTKGPLGVQDNPDLARLLIQHTQKIARAIHLRYWIIQPPNNAQNLCDLLTETGFRETSNNTTPTASVMMDLASDTETLLANMKRQNRQNIRRAERDGITIREGTREDLDTFYRHYQSTSSRQKFTPYPKEYFFRMWDILHRKGYIGLIISEYENTPISGLLIVPFNDTVIAKLFGWSGEYASSRPNEAVFWGAIQWAKKHGYHFFDLQGIDPVGAKALMNGQPLPESLLHSPTFMKLQFGGQVCLFPSAFEYVPDPLFRWSYYKVFPWMTKSGLFQILRHNMHRSSAEV